MVNSIEVRWVNKTNQFHNKGRAYSEASSIDNRPFRTES